MDIHPDLKGVLLDFDGTLVRLPVNWEKARGALALFFQQFGAEISFRPLHKGLLLAQDFLQSHFPETASEIMKKALDIIDRFELGAALDATPCEGAANLLRWLEESKIPFAIVSNNHSQAIRRSLSRLRIPLSPIIVGRNGAVMKPDPQPLLRALEKLNLKKGPWVWMVSDSERDLEAASAMELTCVLVESVRTPETQYTQVGNLHDLLHLWEKR